MKQPLTSSVHASEHDGGDPCYLAVGSPEDLLDVFEEDGDGFGEGV